MTARQYIFPRDFELDPIESTAYHIVDRNEPPPFSARYIRNYPNGTFTRYHLIDGKIRLISQPDFLLMKRHQAEKVELYYHGKWNCRSGVSPPDKCAAKSLELKQLLPLLWRVQHTSDEPSYLEDQAQLIRLASAENPLAEETSSPPIDKHDVEEQSALQAASAITTSHKTPSHHNYKWEEIYGLVFDAVESIHAIASMEQSGSLRRVVVEDYSQGENGGGSESTACEESPASTKPLVEWIPRIMGGELVYISRSLVDMQSEEEFYCVAQYTVDETTEFFHSFSAMQRSKSTSFEELRLYDYSRRKETVTTTKAKDQPSRVEKQQEEGCHPDKASPPVVVASSTPKKSKEEEFKMKQVEWKLQEEKLKQQVLLRCT